MRIGGLLFVLVGACGLAASEPVSVPSAASAASEAVPPSEAPPVVVRTLGDVSDATPLPWIVAMHGLGDDPQRFVRAFDGWTGPPVRVLAARAPDAHGAGWSWFPVRVADGRPEVLTPAILAQSDRIADALDGWADAHAGRGLPVVTGFSQGGMLAFAVGLRHPDKVAGAVPVAGWLPDALVAPHPPAGATTPIRALHGTADTVLAFIPTRRAVDSLRVAGFDVTLQAFDGVGHAIPASVRAAWHAQLAALLPPSGAAPAASDALPVAPPPPAR